MIGNNTIYEREKIEKIADRIERYADRFENANENEKAQHTRKIVEKIRNSLFLDKALEIEKKFMLNIKRKQLLKLRTGNIEKLDGY